MKAAVISFPGSNCDLDLQWAVQTIAGAECELIKPSQTDLSRYDVVMVPGFFLTVTIYVAVRLPGFRQ